jgi:hypothetical protein
MPYFTSPITATPVAGGRGLIVGVPLAGRRSAKPGPKPDINVRRFGMLVMKPDTRVR